MMLTADEQKQVMALVNTLVTMVVADTQDEFLIQPKLTDWQRKRRVYNAKQEIKEVLKEIG